MNRTFQKTEGIMFLLTLYLFDLNLNQTLSMSHGGLLTWGRVTKSKDWPSYPAKWQVRITILILIRI